MPIPTLPSAPQPTDDIPTFNTKSFAFVAAMNPWGVAVQATGNQAVIDAATAVAQAGVATAQAAIATTQAGNSATSAAQSAASASTNAVLWVSGVSYTGGTLQYDPVNFATYRRKATGSGTVAPRLSADYAPAINLQGLIPLGGLLGLANPKTALVTGTDGAVYLRSGNLALASAYPDAPTTLAANPANTSTMTHVSAGNGIIVGVDNNSFPSKIWTTTDGETWTYLGRSGPAGVAITTGTYGAGVWVFPVAGGYWRTSDLISWTFGAWPNTASPVLTNRFYMIFASGMFLVTAGSTTVAYVYQSTDGITWAQVTVPSGQWISIAYGGGRFAICNPSGGTAYSTTGTSGWTSGGAFTGPTGVNLIYAFGRFITLSYTELSYSTDTVSWSNTTVPTSVYTNGPVFNGTNLLIGNTSIGYSYSTTGTSFTSVAGASVPGLVGYTASLNDRVAALPSGVAVFAQNQIVTNSTLTNFRMYNLHYAILDSGTGVQPKTAGDATRMVTIRPTSTAAGYARLVGGQLVTNTLTGGVLVIDSGSGVAFDGTTFVIMRGTTSAYSSTDGLTWATRTLTTTGVGGVNKLAAKAGRWVGITNTTTPNTSTDGTTWTTASATPVSFAFVTVANGVFLAASSTDSLTYYTSTDGVTWTARSLPPAVGSGILAALGLSSYEGSCGTHFVTQPVWDNSEVYIYTSSDGVTWTKRTAPFLASPHTFTNLSTRSSGGNIVLKNTLYSAVSADGGLTWSMAYGGLVIEYSFSALGLVGFNGASAMVATTKYVGVPTEMIESSQAAYYMRIA